MPPAAGTAAMQPVAAAAPEAGKRFLNMVSSAIGLPLGSGSSIKPPPLKLPAEAPDHGSELPEMPEVPASPTHALTVTITETLEPAPPGFGGPIHDDALDVLILPPEVAYHSLSEVTATIGRFLMTDPALEQYVELMAQAMLMIRNLVRSELQLVVDSGWLPAVRAGLACKHGLVRAAAANAVASAASTKAGRNALLGDMQLLPALVAMLKHGTSEGPAPHLQPPHPTSSTSSPPTSNSSMSAAAALATAGSSSITRTASFGGSSPTTAAIATSAATDVLLDAKYSLLALTNLSITASCKMGMVSCGALEPSLGMLRRGCEALGSVGNKNYARKPPLVLQAASQAAALLSSLAACHSCRQHMELGDAASVGAEFLAHCYDALGPDAATTQRAALLLESLGVHELLEGGGVDLCWDEDPDSLSRPMSGTSRMSFLAPGASVNARSSRVMRCLSLLRKDGARASMRDRDSRPSATGKPASLSRTGSLAQRGSGSSAAALAAANASNDSLCSGSLLDSAFSNNQDQTGSPYAAGEGGQRRPVVAPQLTGMASFRQAAQQQQQQPQPGSPASPGGGLPPLSPPSPHEAEAKARAAASQGSAPGIHFSAQTFSSAIAATHHSPEPTLTSPCRARAVKSVAFGSSCATTSPHPTAPSPSASSDGVAHGQARRAPNRSSNASQPIINSALAHSPLPGFNLGHLHNGSGSGNGSHQRVSNGGSGGPLSVMANRRASNTSYITTTAFADDAVSLTSTATSGLGGGGFLGQANGTTPPTVRIAARSDSIRDLQRQMSRGDMEVFAESPVLARPVSRTAALSALVGPMAARQLSSPHTRLDLPFHLLVNSGGNSVASSPKADSRATSFTGIGGLMGSASPTAASGLRASANSISALMASSPSISGSSGRARTPSRIGASGLNGLMMGSSGLNSNLRRAVTGLDG